MYFVVVQICETIVFDDWFVLVLFHDFVVHVFSIHVAEAMDISDVAELPRYIGDLVYVFLLAEHLILLTCLELVRRV